MKQSVLLAPLYAMFLTYSIASLFFGASGVVALEKLEERNRTLSLNLDDLQSKRDDLTARLSTLRSDPEALVIEARSLGLYRDDDFVLRLNRMNSIHAMPDAGDVLHLSPMRRFDETAIRIVSSGIGLIVLLMVFLSRKVSSAYRTK